VGVRLGHRDLEPQRAAVRDGGEVVDGVQLAAGLVRVVHAGNAQAELEAQVLVVAQRAAHLHEVRAGHEDGQLATIDDDALHGTCVGGAGILEDLGEHVDALVEPAAVRPLARTRHGDLADETAVAGRVTGAVRAEHAGTYSHDLEGLAPVRGRGGQLCGLLVAHRRSPVC